MNKLIIGAGLGLIAGLLLAPEKGSETRETIADTAEKWKIKWDKMLGKTGMELDELKKILESEIVGLKDDVRNRILTILEESKSTSSNISKNISNGVL